MISIIQFTSKQILDQVDGLLIDLDGVLYIGNQPIEGAAETVSRLKAENFALRFVTNTTTKSLETLHKKLIAMQLPIEKNEIISATQAAVLYLRQLGSPACFLVLSDDAKRDFAEFPQSDTNPNYIVIGDLGGGPPSRWVPVKSNEYTGTHLKDGPPMNWNYDLLNRIFNMVIRGAEMIALHKGKFWQTEDGLQMDIGAFVAGLEYVTGQTATVIGKPSRTFFETALLDIGVKPARAAMIGDDIDSDIGGAQAAGMKGILVKTGKYREELVKKSSVRPNLVIDSISLL